MLKWFKTIKNRLFGEENNDENKMIHTVMDDQEEHEEQEEVYDEKPVFRFPIITDAEIYGWDDDEVESQREQDDSMPINEPEDDFEPIPLYKNERWPENDVPVNIYRANHRPVYEENEKDDDRNFSTDANKTFKREAKFDKVVKRIPGNRFSPTEVPSPVHGYASQKKRTMQTEFEPKDIEQDNYLKEDSIPEVYATKEVTQQDETPIVNELNTMNVPNIEEQKLPVELAGKEILKDTTLAEFTKLLSVRSHSDEQVSEELPEIITVEDEPLEQLSEELSETISVEDEPLEQVSEELPEIITVEDEPLEQVSEELSETITVEDELLEQVSEALSETISVEDEPLEQVSDDLSEVITVEDEPLEQVSEDLPEIITVEDEPLGQLSEELPETISVEDEPLEQVSDDLSETLTVEDEPLEQVSVELPEVETIENHSAELVVEEASEDSPLDNPIIESVIEEQKKERIVPFNVLMLKSDKEKMKRNEKTFIQQEQPVIKQEVLIDEPVLAENDELDHYVFPSIDYLIPPESQIEDTEWLEMQSEKLEESLSHFGVTATVIEAVQGPTVTRFEFTVGQGTKVSRVRNLTDDLKLTLAARDIRIQAPIPGKSSIGIEIPNRQTRPVRISEVIQTDAFINSSSPLEAVLGLGLTGEPVTIDLRKMPHGMIAGATGSGKSVCINSILVSLLYKASPSELKMMLIDPKMVELAPFNGIPHLISPVITDAKAATAALKWAVNEMERRYELLAHAGVRDIERYNKAATENKQYSLKMPYLLIVIDELADLMMIAPADVEVSISRIAQKARACGIHLIIATQRPSVDVITGTIKANIPTRIAFSVSSQVDSRTIIDTNGAERLLGKGDMLYIGNGQSTSARLQGTFVTDDEIERIIEHVQSEASPTYLFGQDELLKSAVEEEDSLFTEACLFIYQQDSASTSMLQRNFSIGYNRAAKLMDRMEKHGFISAQQGSKARDVYLTESDLEQLSEPAF